MLPWALERTIHQIRKSFTPAQSPFAQTFFHGKKANPKIGDFIGAGLNPYMVNKRKGDTSTRPPPRSYHSGR